MPNATLYTGDARDTLASLPAKSVQTCVTSPPYWGLRDYGEDGQRGLEETPDEYVNNLCDVFDEVRRVLKKDGTFWLVIGDSYYPPKAISSSANFNRANRKSLCLIPSILAISLQKRGWTIRNRIVWHKTNPIPEPVDDRLTTSHEYIFLLTGKQDYYFDSDSIREDAVLDAGVTSTIGQSEESSTCRTDTGNTYTTDGLRNKHDVWNVRVSSDQETNFASFPPDLIEPCVLAGSAEGDTVLDPFSGAGTTGVVALAKGRDYIGIDLSRKYNEMAADRIRQDAPLLNEVQIKEATHA